MKRKQGHRRGALLAKVVMYCSKPAGWSGQAEAEREVDQVLPMMLSLMTRLLMWKEGEAERLLHSSHKGS